MADSPIGRAGRRAVFWTWMAIIGFGLVTFVAVPLSGR
jgi:hypothetical protein